MNSPAHYQSGGLEVIDVIEAFGLGFKLGNAVKYILRAGRKGDRLEDLKKARWYLDREIAKEEETRRAQEPGEWTDADAEAALDRHRARCTGRPCDICEPRKETVRTVSALRVGVGSWMPGTCACRTPGCIACARGLG